MDTQKGNYYGDYNMSTTIDEFDINKITIRKRIYQPYGKDDIIAYDMLYDYYYLSDKVEDKILLKCYNFKLTYVHDISGRNKYCHLRLDETDTNTQKISMIINNIYEKVLAFDKKTLKRFHEIYASNMTVIKIPIHDDIFSSTIVKLGNKSNNFTNTQIKNVSELKKILMLNKLENSDCFYVSDFILGFRIGYLKYSKQCYIIPEIKFMQIRHNKTQYVSIMSDIDKLDKTQNLEVLEL